jgi:hypothetical protein
MWNKGFEGWYFKHQKGDDTIAFIPGRAETGAFVQILSAAGSRQFDVPELSVERGVIRAGNCRFSRSGCKIDLPGIRGEIRYGGLTPLRSDIMGPFRFFPMECRHGVISMAHSLSGSLSTDGEVHRFDGGIGYIEKDSGISFPRSYLWLQCSDFPGPCELVVSIAHIPFGGMSFTGCICAIVYRGREYRLATYHGVRLLAVSEEHLCLSQGRLLLEIDLQPLRSGHPLRAPVHGKMSGTIRESSNALVHARLWNRGKPVFALHSEHASFEYVPESRKYAFMPEKP